jgi:hypothetical protein
MFCDPPVLRILHLNELVLDMLGLLWYRTLQKLAVREACVVAPLTAAAARHSSTSVLSALGVSGCVCLVLLLLFATCCCPGMELPPICGSCRPPPWCGFLRALRLCLRLSAQKPPACGWNGGLHHARSLFVQTVPLLCGKCGRWQVKPQVDVPCTELAGVC